MVSTLYFIFSMLQKPYKDITFWANYQIVATKCEINVTHFFA